MNCILGFQEGDPGYSKASNIEGVIVRILEASIFLHRNAQILVRFIYISVYKKWSIVN